MTSTGLDQIVFLDKNSGDIKSIKSALGRDPWYRFDPKTDYRLIHSTRPHAAHPNYVLKIDGDYWVTRCKQEDCVNLNDFSQLIDLTDSACISVHDGVLWNEKLIFTRVDGLLIVCDPVTKSKVEVIDIFEGHAQRPYGWCRGLHVSGDTIYIGFSSLRKTKLISKLKYLAKSNTRYFERKNALVVKYSITQRKVEGVLHLRKGIDAIYGISPFDF